MTAETRERVAIVGMAVLYPGADSLETYWRNLVDGVDAITDVPVHRWRPEYYDPDSDRPDRVYCRRGGFVDEFAEFDPVRFGTVPVSIPNTEAEQLLALRVAAAAIDDAGGPDALPDRQRVGVIIGRGGNPSSASINFYSRIRLATDMRDLVRQLIPEIGEDRLELLRGRVGEMFGTYRREDVIGLVPNLTASRIANRLDLRGPAYTIDAACASSLIAVDHGVSELLSGRLDAVLAGGVHHSHDIGYWSLFSQLGAMSRRGEIRPFDASADGLIIGEGTGVVLLKRLSDALRDGDRVYAVIRGTGVSSDGRAASLFNPESAGQSIAVRRAWADAGLDPTDVDALGMLEAHGTATPTGDAAELATVAGVFGPRPAGGRSPAVIGSVKSMIGHTMPAAGIAALVKTALAVSRGVLLPTLHCENPRPEMADTRFAPIATARAWEPGPGPRRAAVNAFGFGGINAHIILEQQPAPRPAHRPGSAGRVPAGPRPSVDEPDQVVLLTAPDRASLAQILAGDDADIRAYGTTAAATAGPATGCRLAVVRPTARRLGIARQAVAAGTAWRGLRDVWFSPAPLLAGGKGGIAFVFPGLEREYLPRVDDLVARFGMPEGVEAPAAGRPGPVTFTAAEMDERTFNLVRLGQLLTHALNRVGVVPDAVVGYSLGEWTAGMVAGLADGPTLLSYGALLQPGTPREDLAMAVVAMSGTVVGQRLAGYPGVVVSHDNSPTQSVVCGPQPDVLRLVADLRRDGVVCQPLPFVTALHTPYMAASAAPLHEQRDWSDTDRATHDGPRPAMWSPTLAAPAPATAAGIRELYLRQLTEPVRFRPTIMAMYQAGVRVFLQLGPGQVASLVQDNLRERDHLTMPVNVTHHSGLNQLRRVAAAMWVEGAAVDLRSLVPAPAPVPARRATVRLNLGTTAFDLGDGADQLLGLSRPAAIAALAPAALSGLDAGSPELIEFAGLLRDTVDSAGAVLAAFNDTPAAEHRSTLRVSLDTMPYLRDHCFFRQPDDWPQPADRWPVVPAAAVIQHIIDAVEGAESGARVIGVSDARFRRWTLAEPAQDIEITATPAAGRHHVTFGRNASATIDTAPGYPESPPVWWHDPDTERRATIGAERLYRDRVLFHGPAYQGLTTVYRLGERHARGSVRVLPATGAVFDAGWHLLSSWLVHTEPQRTVAYPVSIGALRLFGPPPAVGTEVECVARIQDIDGDRIVGAVQFSIGGRVWAELTDCVHRRFDSEGRLRQQERFPGRQAVSQRQPEGFTTVFDCWTDAMSRAFTARHVLGMDDFANYDRQPTAQARRWLLGRLAVKDAVRYGCWDSGAGDVFPIEVRVSNDSTGRPTVTGWSGRPLPEHEVSLADTGEVAVALARPAGGPPVGIDVTEITERPDGTLRSTLSDAELALLSTLDGSGEAAGQLWVTRFRSAKEAVARAEGTGLGGGARRFAVSAATPDTLTVRAGDHVYQVGHREVHNPPGLPPRRYVVAWTPIDAFHRSDS
jgi:acyl transferase domain-containing protein